jgi:hypothetical protein
MTVNNKARFKVIINMVISHRINIVKVAFWGCKLYCFYLMYN